MKYILLTLALFVCIPADAQEPDGMTPQSCRASQDTNVIANCIEAGAYDPCDDSGGKWGQAQCAWAHSLVAERRIEKALKALQAKSIQAGIFDKYRFVEWSQKNFALYRDQYCLFKGAASETPDKLTGEMLGYCIRRLNEERAADLEGLIKLETRAE